MAAPARLQPHVAESTPRAPIAQPRRDTILHLRGAAFVADPSGALYWPDEHMLVVADLHLEKGSSYAARRVFLPPYDTAATLARLAALIAQLSPRRVVALGDSFHDQGGAARLLARDVQALRAMQIGRDWLWIAGNHDPAETGLAGDHALDLTVRALCFRHEPSEAVCDGEVAGHLHPVAIVGGRGGAVRRRCFIANANRCIVPAFGAYAGGLNILDTAFGCVTDGCEPAVHVLGQSAVYTVATRHCLADSTSVQLAWR